MSRRRAALQAVDTMAEGVEAAVEDVRRVGRPRLDPHLADAPTASVRISGADDALIARLMRERDQSRSEVIRDALRAGLRALRVPVATRPGRI